MDLHDHTPGGKLIFPSDMEGEYRLLETTLYNPEDDDKPDPDDSMGQPKYGNWLKVEPGNRDDAHLLRAVGELVQELQRIEVQKGDAFEVTRCVKAGPNQSDPYEVNVEGLEDGQDRL